ncbi:MAG: hypothetical protein JTJ12_00520 [Eubacterium sp.]|nr:hypothetical protein [Eubacterium sp.]
MRKNKGYGITRVMFVVSSFFLIIIMSGLLTSGKVKGQMENQNYLLSSTEEQKTFEQMLNENEIPYERISDTSFSVKKEWKDKADDIFNKLLK